MLRVRIKKDTRLRVKENKSILDIENIPGLNGEPPDNAGDNSGNNQGNNQRQGNNQCKSNHTGDNQDSSAGENKDNGTADAQPMTKRQQHRQNKRKKAEMATVQGQR